MYQPYRGQRARRSRAIRIALIATLCAFIVACLVFLLFFQSKNTITLFGREFTFPWAHSSADDGKKKEDDMGFQIVEQDDADDGTQENTNPAPSIASASKTIEIPSDKVYDQAYIAQVVALKSKGVNTAAITIKNQSGAITGVDGIKPTLDTLRAAGIQTVAIFYAYEDDAYAKQDTTAALKNTQNQSWRTGAGMRWLNPNSDAANTYLLGNIRACKAAGFDEIVLRSFGWPAAGRLDRIAYGEDNTGDKRAEALARRLAAISEEAAPTKISVQLDDPTAEHGLNQASGQDVAKLYAAATHIYVPMVVQTETSGDSIRTIIGQLTGDDGSKIIPMYTNITLVPSLFAADAAFYLSLTESGGALPTL